MEDTFAKVEDLPPSSSASPVQSSAQPDGKPLTPKLDLSNSSSATPPRSTPTEAKPRAQPSGPQLVGHLPRAEEQAYRSFTEIAENHYQYGTLGKSREALESMLCDCQYEHGVDHPTDACGDGSDCINRLTQVECLPDDCRCHSYCQNQRFQRKEYAPLEIVQTEQKGFGLRAGGDIPRDGFIYEYIGDVVSHPSFMKRMRDYASEGVKHFYFMMLQKDEYIDATKRGGIGRFANHSCNPNCYVAKWTIGNRVRMGIFAKRNVKKDEEITFNYNVDRYGHDAQPCYCGEANCVGFLGGKTQTDLAAMDDLYLEALGITDEVEQLGLKGSKKKKGKKLDEDYMPVLKPLVEKDVPKLIQAMRQTQSRKVLFKLLTRIKITQDQSALRQLMRLRGFSVMTNILEDYASDVEITQVAIESMMSWPLIQRNKVEDSKVDEPVRLCAQTAESDALKELAQKLLDQWDALEVGYRIPKRLKTDGEGSDETVTVVYEDNTESRPIKRSRVDDLMVETKLDIKPLGFSSRPLPTPNYASYVVITPLPTATRRVGGIQQTRNDIAAIIAAATAAAAAAPKAPASAEQSGNGESSSSKKSKSGNGKKKMSKEEKEALKMKRLLKLVGAVVVKCMSKYQGQMDHDLFKKHAKELTQLIADKEKKSSSYKENKLEALSEEKIVKIKKFAKEYIAKLMRKLEKSGQRRKPSHSSHSTSNGASTSGGDGSKSARTPDGGDEHDGEHMAMSVEEAMGMDLDDHDDGEDGDGEEEGDDHEPDAGGSSKMDEDQDSPEPHSALPPPSSASPSQSHPQPRSPQSSLISPSTRATSDPRLRSHPSIPHQNGAWDSDDKDRDRGRDWMDGEVDCQMSNGHGHGTSVHV
ncbi:hypothetical protein JAAARDRAFT_132908 [Jaapia argillacea MUCL 33604]|uniref:Histone-lysine N-methyltransferase, H3 lysine-36 specific n=1 Tax=Jaapia argillacea MUCL 33604 TaxID=933084 RepID=A0A067PX80_9AGAM|nr:hypothetical protein JAAARDRAFT_132908 [Jaapia argillacea MUCL 33604]